MSKSAENPLSRISLLDDESKMRKAIMKATTDSDGLIRFDPAGKPGISNLLNIYSAFSGLSVADIEKKYDGVGYGAFKKELAELTVDALAPIRKSYDDIRRSEELRTALKDGAEKANAIAARTMSRVKEALGLGLG
jgi:tryptophanyl-tRNA synthetase